MLNITILCKVQYESSKNYNQLLSEDITEIAIPQNKGYESKAVSHMFLHWSITIVELWSPRQDDLV